MKIDLFSFGFVGFMILSLLGVWPCITLADPPRVTVRRVPQGGVQPQVGVDSAGTVHLIYLKGDASQSDIFYVRSGNGGTTWSVPIRVNSQAGSALAIGNVRGAQIAVGRGGRVHVAWMGSKTAEPKAPDDMAPMLYTRLADDGKSFEPQRNVVRAHPGLDGGGSVAADDSGNVFVAWHAPTVPKTGEQNRRIWIARSTDDGSTFATEVPVSDSSTGACGCCGMRLIAAGGRLFALYRGASKQINRGMYLIDASTDLTTWHDREIAPMKMGMCVMSTSAFFAPSRGLLAAWETSDHVFWSNFDATALDARNMHPVPESGRAQKHPAIAANADGLVLVSWAEGTGWNKGGSVCWALFDSTGHEVPHSAGRMEDLPPWDAPVNIICADGSFNLLY